MNEILINIISVLVTAVVLPLISFVGTKLISWLNTKVKDENAKMQLTVATNIVKNAVLTVFQTYVDSLKASGTFNAQAQSTALLKAKEYIIKNYGDIETWLTTQIESTIKLLKSK